LKEIINDLTPTIIWKVTDDLQTDSQRQNTQPRSN